MQRWFIQILAVALWAVPSIADAQREKDPFPSQRAELETPPVQGLPDQEIGQESIEDLQNQLRLLKEKLSADTNRLKNELKDRAVEHAVLFHERKELQRGLNANIAMSQIRDKFLLSLLEDLLGASQVSDQLIGLRRLIEFHDLAIAESVACVSASRPLVLNLAKLINSEHEEVNQQAVRALQRIDPRTAREEGFQAKTGFWWSASLNSEDQILHLLSQPTRFNYDETPFVDVVEEFESWIGIPVELDSNVTEDSLITIQLSEQILIESIGAMLEAHDMTFQLTVGGLHIYLKGDRRAVNVQTYCVRGLLTDECSIDDISEIVSGQVGENGKVKKLDPHRIAVIADQIQQNRVSRALGALQTK